ncbi:hypothetical protein [Paenibacillus graminis]|uniref:hypothetical protein n=1 Tax=Paenibacillus graminis TaxID=189425 RepID=UPI000470E149|nr:hypothetical protein [Paenibacillus graminis]
MKGSYKGDRASGNGKLLWQPQPLTATLSGEGRRSRFVQTTTEMPLLSQQEAMWRETTAEMPLLSQHEPMRLETTAEMPLLS